MVEPQTETERGAGRVRRGRHREGSEGCWLSVHRRQTLVGTNGILKEEVLAWCASVDFCKEFSHGAQGRHSLVSPSSEEDSMKETSSCLPYRLDFLLLATRKRPCGYIRDSGAFLGSIDRGGTFLQFRFIRSLLGASQTTVGVPAFDVLAPLSVLRRQ